MTFGKGLTCSILISCVFNCSRSCEGRTPGAVSLPQHLITADLWLYTVEHTDRIIHSRGCNNALWICLGWASWLLAVQPQFETSLWNYQVTGSPPRARCIISELQPKSVQEQNIKPVPVCKLLKCLHTYHCPLLFWSGGKGQTRGRLTVQRTVTNRDNWLIKDQISEHSSSIACCECKREKRATKPNSAALQFSPVHCRAQG